MWEWVREIVGTTITIIKGGDEVEENNKNRFSCWVVSSCIPSEYIGI